MNSTLRLLMAFGVVWMILIWLENQNIDSAKPRVTPLGLLVSRWIYWRTETDWHYGRSPESLSGNTMLRVFHLSSHAGSLPPWLGWVDRLKGETLPPAGFIRQTPGSCRERDRNEIVLRLMELSLRFDPGYARVYREMAFIEDREQSNPRLAERTLLQGLAEVHEPGQGLGLLVDLFFVRYYSLHDPSSARFLGQRVEAAVRECHERDWSESETALRACLYLLKHTGART